jgi:hypothetical protein
MAQASIVSLAAITAVGVMVGIRSSWLAAAAAALTSVALCLVAFVVARRSHSTRVRRQAADGLPHIEAMLAVAATVSHGRRGRPGAGEGRFGGPGTDS